jgi:hypothetical protein
LSVPDVLERLRDVLDAIAIPYMVTGSFASSAHGIPRATNDLDVIIAPTSEQLEELLRRLPDSQYYSNVEEARDALRRRSQFNVIDFDGMWKIDFIVKKRRPFSERELHRRSIVEIAGVRMQTASPEDVLISKLEWAKLGESERQLRDAVGIIRVQGERLDVDYVERWVAALELEAQWEAALSMSR